MFIIAAGTVLLGILMAIRKCTPKGASFTSPEVSQSKFFIIFMIISLVDILCCPLSCSQAL